MPKVKICGLTRSADVAEAVLHGADFIGFVLAPSKRRVTLNQAKELFTELAYTQQAVAVMVDATTEQLSEVVEAGFSWVQCHGRVPMSLPLGLRGWRAISGAEWGSNQRLPDPWWTWLLDGPQSGSGLAFDWSSLVRERPLDRFFVAGGLNPENVKGVIEQVQPFGVDVSSGVESAPGVKDARLIRKFIERTKDDHE